VPCNSTVPHGTDIQCVPALISKSSAYTTTGTLASLVASTSVTLWSSRLTQTKQFSVVPETRNAHAHLVIVPATSSKISSGFSSSALFVASKETSNHRKKRKLHWEEDQKMGVNMKICLISGAALTVTVVGIVYRLWKRRTIQLHTPTSTTITDTDPTVRKTDTCTVDPTTVTAVYSRARPEDDQDKEEKGNQRFQSNSVYVDSCEEISETIPSSLDVINPEGGQSNEVTGHQEDFESDDDLLQLDPPAPESPTDISNVTSIVTHSVQILVQNPIFQPVQLAPQYLDMWNRIAGGLDQETPVNWSALSQTEKHLIKILKVPFRLLFKLCLSLDIKRTDGKDVRLLAHELGLTVTDFDLLQQAAQNVSSTYILLRERFSVKKPSGTVGDFVDVMKQIGRDDIISLINEWDG